MTANDTAYVVLTEILVRTNYPGKPEERPDGHQNMRSSWNPLTPIVAISVQLYLAGIMCQTGLSRHL